MYYTMVLARLLDERMWILNRQGKVAFVISGQGQEGAQVGSAYALRPGTDFVLPYYRDLTVALTIGMTPREVMLALFARAADPASGGRQMPGHYGHRQLNIVSGSSPIATQIPHAVGIALASKIKREDVVTAVYFGEAASSKGDFHEGLNLAGVLRPPVVFVCENNGYAISVPQEKQMPIANVADRAPAYGFPGVVTDGNDVLDVYRAMRAAVDRARAGDGPTLIECKTYRIVPHSSDDDESRYRQKVEVEEWKRNGPIERLQRYMETQGIWNASFEQAVQARAMAEVDDATEYAERAPAPNPATLIRHVFANGST
ncbi:MAG: thiamine pyrophosphate-dependent dehydrogenase E1 component subunit alpha [Chloroflexota bacterium]|nr:thiamine pyrophosphate-dependent dehydrogenase E1 component subunit alpha [Chloroflexota bacterium]